jgi:hypothetical protein
VNACVSKMRLMKVSTKRNRKMMIVQSTSPGFFEIIVEIA